MAVSSVSAAEPGDANISGVIDQGEYLFIDGDSIDLESGNVTSASLQTNLSTYRWAGLYGNVTGNIVLGDSDENQLFTWTASGRVVYASELAAPSWADLADANEAAVEADYAFLDSTDSSDGYNTTFVGVAEAFGSLIWPAVTSDFATTLSSGATTWKTYSLTDASGGTDIIFASPVSGEGVAFDGETADFQMMVPEDGEAGDNAPTTFNLWVELV